MIFDMTKRKSGGGEEVFYAPYSGVQYTKDVDAPTLFTAARVYRQATNLVSYRCLRTTPIGGQGYPMHEVFYECSNLERVEFPRIQSVGNGWCDYLFGDCPKLTTAIFGSVGYPLTAFYNTSYANRPFYRDTQSTLTITIYVDAVDLASVPAAITNYAPWGATNATIVYRSSTSGEVLGETHYANGTLIES